MQTKLSLNQTIKVRSVWISDIHLGFRGCSAEYLLDFLHQVECEYLYLVGDIIDVWVCLREVWRLFKRKRASMLASQIMDRTAYYFF